MEEKRHNPEIVFTMILQKDITLEDIETSWEGASDRWESV